MWQNDLSSAHGRKTYKNTSSNTVFPQAFVACFQPLWHHSFSTLNMKIFNIFAAVVASAPLMLAAPAANVEAREPSELAKRDFSVYVCEGAYVSPISLSSMAAYRYDSSNWTGTCHSIVPPWNDCVPFSYTGLSGYKSWGPGEGEHNTLLADIRSLISMLRRYCLSVVHRIGLYWYTVRLCPEPRVEHCSCILAVPHSVIQVLDQLGRSDDCVHETLIRDRFMRVFSIFRLPRLLSPVVESRNYPLEIILSHGVSPLQRGGHAIIAETSNVWSCSSIMWNIYNHQTVPDLSYDRTTAVPVSCQTQTLSVALVQLVHLSEPPERKFSRRRTPLPKLWLRCRLDCPGE